MTFMLGAFTDGLTSGAKWASGLWDDKARRDSINEDTRGHKLTNDANRMHRPARQECHDCQRGRARKQKVDP